MPRPKSLETFQKEVKALLKYTTETSKSKRYKKWAANHSSMTVTFGPNDVHANEKIVKSKPKKKKKKKIVVQKSRLESIE